MTEGPTVQRFVQSFVVRVYRFDPADPRQVAGVIEPVDNSGTSRPFADTTQLGEALCTLLAGEDRVPGSPGAALRSFGSQTK